MVKTELTVGEIISGGMEIGKKNFLSLLGAMILWGLTIWIPYINMGTTIALVNLPSKLSQGGTVSPLEIFDPKYRKYIGEYFIHWALKGFGTYFSVFVGFFPITLSWLFTELLILDKGLSPAEAFSASSTMTYGHKWKIFFAMILFAIIAVVAMIVAGYVLALIPGAFGGFIMLVGMILLLSFLSTVKLGMIAHLYKRLS